LTLYKKYIEYKNNGTFGQVLEDIYDAGHKSNWLKGIKEIKTTSNTDSHDEILSSLNLLPTGFWSSQ
jgi:PAB-dependent poly(A)-specific ribonuclease subunit 2